MKMPVCLFLIASTATFAAAQHGAGGHPSGGGTSHPMGGSMGTPQPGYGMGSPNAGYGGYGYPLYDPSTNLRTLESLTEQQKNPQLSPQERQLLQLRAMRIQQLSRDTDTLYQLVNELQSYVNKPTGKGTVSVNDLQNAKQRQEDALRKAKEIEKLANSVRKNMQAE